MVVEAVGHMDMVYIFVCSKAAVSLTARTNFASREPELII